MKVKRIMPVIFLTALLFVSLPALAQKAVPPQAKQNAVPAQPKQDPAQLLAKKEMAEIQAKLDKQKAEEEKLQVARDLVHQWFRAWNTLDGSEESIKRFLDLYQPDGRHLMGPRENQTGPVLYEGQEEIRQLAEQMPKAYTRVSYFIKSRTINEQTEESIYAAATPFGVQVSLEFGGTHDVADSSANAPKAITQRGGGVSRPGGIRRFIVPGAAFFEIQDGKISRLRIYYAGGETAEVTGSFYAGCGN